MKLPIYHVDAFTSRMFGGNPAAVVTLDQWLPDETLQAIAAENNLSETAFVVAREEPAPLRWFTPTVEVDLCGHATLAAGHVLFAEEAYLARDILAVFETEADICELRPHFERIAALDAFAVIVSAPGTEVDFVSRFFGPRAGVPEDPVTGSAHCTLIPYWAARLGKRRLAARQLSRRVGELDCELRGDRVAIAGNTVEYLRGEISVPAETI